ncbi:MAG: UDP-N-acetylmuramoyl-L-alanyl-D-glutamate--2,6-diaminopimelate ligase [Deltaproteobacteria bacterium]|nr:UDP-N-acetylmuramoyl-L-alanyl-D-glutamate--2,6-diaminopimelate ligase [Deltaproteobacteria bacterium]
MSELTALLHGLDARLLGAPPSGAAASAPITRVTIDSRRAGPGTVFVACPGATPSSKDGHDFLEAAVLAGAAALVVQREERGRPFLDRVPVVVVPDARRAAAVMAERAAGEPSAKMAVVGVTGTNGKTTVTWLVAQLAAFAGKKSAVLGTLGVGPVTAPRSLGFTTPEAEVISGELARLAAEGVEVVAMEVSSHALATARVDGLRFAAVGFTNLTRDHLDFHGTMDAYFEAKSRLFTELRRGAGAVVPVADDEEGWAARLRAATPGAITWGPGGALEAVEVTSGAAGTKGVLVHAGRRARFTSPLLGAWNVENLLVAAGCCLALGLTLEQIAAGLATAVPPAGRLERVGDGAPLVVVDYAHTPDALERALHVLRGICAGKLTVVFGCGGDRDPGKRALMGAVAAQCADAVVVTDDNPRSEDGDAIAAAIEAGIGARLRRAEPSALERGTWTRLRARRMAIRAAIAASGPDDAVLIAGKGHERSQTLGARVLPFDDVTEAKRALGHASAPAFLDAAFIERALADRGVELHGRLPGVLLGVSTDSRAIEPGSLFVALKGESFDGHGFVKQAIVEGGALAAMVERGARATVVDQWPLVIVDDTLRALQDLARAYLATLVAKKVALTGSNGKTTTKELIAAALRAGYGEPFVLATEGNLNNHIGVPLTALRAEPEHRALVFELGMNHLGEIAALCRIVRPEVGLITNIGTAHAGNVGGVEGVAQAKAELFEALPESGVAVVNADDPRCVREAQSKARCRQLAFGRAPWAEVRLLAARDLPQGGQELELSHASKTVEVTIPLDGRHNAVNAAGAVAVGVALGLPFADCALGLAGVRGAHGRLERRVRADGAWILDDTYNANPDSMEAALATMAELAGQRRRVVALGEMRELGSYAEAAHRHIGAAAAQAGAALLLCCGEHGRLYGEGAMRAGLAADRVLWAADSAALAPLARAQVHAGDVVLVKGSRGARMERVVEALTTEEAR